MSTDYAELEKYVFGGTVTGRWVGAGTCGWALDPIELRALLSGPPMISDVSSSAVVSDVSLTPLKSEDFTEKPNRRKMDMSY